MAVSSKRLGPSIVQSWAPGRVTFVGDHTDYNFGLSLAAALPRGTWARVSAQLGTDSFSCVDDRGPAGWERYAQACVQLVRTSYPTLPPVEVEVWGDLPIGRGLSSSASLISSTLASLYGLLDVACPSDELALQAQRVENDYLGIPTGTLDQEAIVKSPHDRAVLVDFGLDTSEAIPLPSIAGYRFLVVDPGLPRQLDAANYGDRRAECTSAITALLGASDREAWLRFRDGDWGEVLNRRLAHVWSENRRVRAMVDALGRSDASAIRDLINESHASLRDNFEVSTPAMEAARSAILKQPGIEAARMVGAGFGGCLLAFAAEDAVLVDYPSFVLD